MPKVLNGIVLLMFLTSCSSDPKTHITQTDLLQQLHSALPPVLIDVRSDLEYRAGHIPSALHIPFWSSFTTKTLQHIPNNQALVLYCEHGPRAGIAKWGLAMQGFDNIRYLEGHMMGWRKAGLEITKESKEE